MQILLSRFFYDIGYSKNIQRLCRDMIVSHLFPMIINRKHSKYTYKRSNWEDTNAAEQVAYCC
jgi:hypothetical protein